MIGTVTYLLPAKYSIQRSQGWPIGIAAGMFDTAQVAPGEYELYAPGAIPYVRYTFRLSPNYYVWTTTAFTTDYILSEAYYSFPPFTTNIPADVTIDLTYSPSNHHPVIWLRAFGYNGAAAIYELPPPPPTFWNQNGFPPA